MNVQLFGTQKSQDTRKALRFFKERGIDPHFVDLAKREIAPGELRRFVQKFGLEALIDRDSRAFERSGLAYMVLSEEDWFARLAADPRLLVQPLVRSGNVVSVGWDEGLWRDEVAREGA